MVKPHWCFSCVLMTPHIRSRHQHRLLCVSGIIPLCHQHIMFHMCLSSNVSGNKYHMYSHRVKFPNISAWGPGRANAWFQLVRGFNICAWQIVLIVQRVFFFASRAPSWHISVIELQIISSWIACLGNTIFVIVFLCTFPKPSLLCVACSISLCYRHVTYHMYHVSHVSVKYQSHICAWCPIEYGLQCAPAVDVMDTFL